MISGVCACGAGAANADHFINFAPLFGDFSATTGMETVVSNIKNFDQNSADASSNAATSWAYKLVGYRLDGLDGIDTNNDGMNDTRMVTHIYETTSGIEGADGHIVTLNPATGAFLSGVTYSLVR